YAGLQDYPRAIAAAQEALAIDRSLKVQDLESETLLQLGELYRKTGQTNLAISFYQAALATNPTLELPGSGSAPRIGLARVYRSLNMPSTAIAYYKQAVSGVEQVRRKIQGLPPQLQLSFLQAGHKGDRAVDVYRELADLLLSQGRNLEAQQVLELLKVQELHDYTHSRGKSPEVPLTATEEQILKDNNRLIAIGQQISNCYQTQCSQLNQLLDQQNALIQQINQGEQNVERAAREQSVEAKKIQTNLIVLGQQIADCHKTQCPQLSQLNDQRDALVEQFNQKIESIEPEVRNRLSQDPGFLDPEKFNLQAENIVEAQPGTLLIYPLVLEDKIWLLWASQGGIVQTIVVPVKRSQLSETVKRFRDLLGSPSSNIAEVKATAKQLYDWLIKPLEPELKANKIQNLVFALDGVTRYIPMSALFDGEKYLIENYAVSEVLSASLTDTSDRLSLSTQNTSVLALGLSDAVPPDFGPLPNVPTELNAIVRHKPDTHGIYPGDKFLNHDFDYQTLRDHLLGHQILHIATHAEFVEGSPEQSFILLGTGKHLPISQINVLQDLGNVHLVVLSACKTALGHSEQNGAEIPAISYYFLNKGAKAVMASLWEVDDLSTSILMQQFYSNLAQGTNQVPITKATALRQAQLALLHPESRRGSIVAVKPLPGELQKTVQNYSHPFYWAPFILIGNNL
ncbi:MAG: CHAT domain-containing protein, partial [Chroococcidiopsidaceae cyanobacterium CP_BM_ER_R8_30]|nr:CHAT domain-containing protein [Chroococcidiopsidaceae cyanobacterium CP_BM_ER_R8_30]